VSRMYLSCRYGENKKSLQTLALTCGAAEFEQRLRLRSRALARCHHRSPESCQTCQRLPYGRENISRWASAFFSGSLEMMTDARHYSH
jgi:hypothetical protein